MRGPPWPARGTGRITSQAAGIRFPRKRDVSHNLPRSETTRKCRGRHPFGRIHQESLPIQRSGATGTDPSTSKPVGSSNTLAIRANRIMLMGVPRSTWPVVLRCNPVISDSTSWLPTPVRAQERLHARGSLDPARVDRRTHQWPGYSWYCSGLCRCQPSSFCHLPRQSLL